MRLLCLRLDPPLLVHSQSMHKNSVHHSKITAGLFEFRIFSGITLTDNCIFQELVDFFSKMYIINM